MAVSTTFAPSKLKRIVKADDEVAMIKKEALQVLDRATVEFIGVLVDEWVKDSRSAKTLTYAKLSQKINSIEAFEFLSEIVPEEKNGGADAMLAIFKKNKGSAAQEGDQSEEQPGDVEDELEKEEAIDRANAENDDDEVEPSDVEQSSNADAESKIADSGDDELAEPDTETVPVDADMDE
ncbi:hypothetical protein NDN08_004657 [Rhodosorus marinus]|uniref:Transcription factor CBF/NF-Y/archaeal histone domain-containing protein n=1 Tax=Rhodosorus marinus TaxID=101924 RepID=A0AAV8UPN2_9RHOD|nr:hypothetical protein NDN08_004657 [Rhodosorus marinus]